jgi:SAM-dependent methyltransferase
MSPPSWASSIGKSTQCNAPTLSSSPRVLSLSTAPLAGGVYDSRTNDAAFALGTFDVVISNGVINLSPVKHQVFAEAARVLKPGGWLAVADIVSGKPLKERTRRNVELWDACSTYVESISLAARRS